jgi:hypothetical protein
VFNWSLPNKVEKMNEDPMDNDKINELFSEIVKSSNISGISDMDDDSGEKSENPQYELKHLIFLQEILADCISNVSQVIFMLLEGEPPVDQDLPDVLGALYKIAEDFNGVMVQLYIETDEDLTEDEDGEQ